ncbi:MAG: insulinase family protein, partial [Chloroflexi bacterium]|nr:insulinase family protein [Chloroflexota bacterium]
MPPTTRPFLLDNGLQVILREVHTAPLISTWVWYRVGSRNEIEGATGLSHWVEHMMFKGTPQFGKGEIMRQVQRYGGNGNAFTSHDFTAYYETLPSPQAELALRIEADRMVNSTFDPAEVDAERTVIISEREGSENEASYMLYEEMTAIAFRVHSYHHQTIGWKSDLEAITRDQLYNHYRQYYAPNNAVLIAVGDLDTDAYLALVERHFGGLQPSALPASAVRSEPPARGERRLTLGMPGHAPIVRVSFHTPPVAHEDFIPLVVLDAALSGGKAIFSFDDSQARSARLYRALVETQLATSAGSGYHPSLDPYLLTLIATVRDGRTPAEAESALVAEAERLKREAVQPRELAVAIRQAQAQFAYNSESADDQALTLGFLEMLDTHTRFDGLLGELAQVTPDDVLRVARTYLNEDNRVVGWFVPSDEGGDCGSDDAEGTEALRPPREPRLWAYTGGQPARAHAAGASERRSGGLGPDTILRARLDNGATVLIVENPASASVHIAARLGVGASADDAQQMGRANLTAALLRRGTAQHSFQELNVLLEDVGASLESDCGSTGLELEGVSLADDLSLLVEALNEVLTQPTFPEEELAKLRGQLLTQLGVLENDTGYRAQRALAEALYPGHPFGRPRVGTRASVAQLRREDLLQCYRTQYHPASLVLSVVGAVEASQVLDLLA